MADRYSQVPEHNNIRCVQEDTVLPSKHHIKNQDKFWFNETIYDWQTSRCYKQPIQKDDLIYFELHRQDSYDCYFEIYNSSGIKIQDRVDADFVIYDSNSVYTKPDGTQIPLSVHKWKFRFSDLVDNSSVSLPVGVYVLRFVVEFFNADTLALEETRYWISEPLNVQEDHPDTVYIEYRNEVNKDDIIYKYDTSNPDAAYKGSIFIAPTFGMRVEGTITNPSYDAEDFDTREQDFDERILDRFAWQAHELIIGGAEGVPQYMIDKFNKFIGCDYVSCETYGRIVKASGSKVELQGEIAENPLYKASVKFRYYDRQDAFTDTRGSTFDIVTIDTYPCALKSINFTGKGMLIGAVLDNNTERGTLVTYLNGAFADANNLNGTFQVVDNVLQYVNASDENYTAGDNEVYTTYFTLSLQTTSANQKMAFWMLNTSCVWDVGETLSGASSAIFQKPITSSGSFVYPKYTYANTGTYTSRVFMRNATDEIYMLKNTTTNPYTCQVKNITGNLPSGLKVFGLEGADFSAISGGLDMSFLANCRTNIRSIILSNCGIDELNGNVFEGYPSIGIGGSSANWSQIAYLSIQYNQLDATEVADFIVKYYDFAPHIILSTINLIQTPTVTIIDATALADITDLQYAGHVVYY